MKPEHDYLASEMAQAWSHYRHMEETRTKYLSFFATVILTASGFAVTLMKDLSGIDQAQFVSSLSLFVFLLFVFSFFVWANITRIGFVLAAYEIVLKETRKYLLGEESPAYQLWNIRGHIPPQVSRGMFRIQSAATYLALGVCVLLLGTEAYLSCVALNGSIAGLRWQGYFILTASAFMLGSILYGFATLRKARSFRPPTMFAGHRQTRIERELNTPAQETIMSPEI